MQLFPLRVQAIGTARAAGLSIPDSAITYVEETTLLEYAESHPKRATIPASKHKFKPSMLVDLEAGRPMEVEGIVGGVVKRAREIGFAVPRCVNGLTNALRLPSYDHSSFQIGNGICHAVASSRTPAA